MNKAKKNGKALATPEQIDSALATLEKNIHPITVESQKIVVKDEKTKTLAVDFLTKIKDAKKLADDDRKSFVGPLNAVVKNINARYKPKTAILDQADKTVRAKVIAFHEAEEERARVEQEKLQKKEDKKHDRAVEKAEKKGWEPPPEAAQVEVSKSETTMAGSSGSAQVRKVWDFEVTEESKIPRKFLVLDKTTLRNALKEGLRKNEAPPEIAGIRFFQKSGLAV